MSYHLQQLLQNLQQLLKFVVLSQQKYFLYDEKW